jgi:hypothetical protein
MRISRSALEGMAGPGSVEAVLNLPRVSQATLNSARLFLFLLLLLLLYLTGWPDDRDQCMPRRA